MRTELELAQLSKEWMAAAKERDRARLRDLMAPEYTEARGGDGHVDRSTWLRDLSKMRVARYDVTNVRVHVEGSAALVRSHQSWESLPGSAMPSAEAECVDVWVKGRKGWRVLRRQIVAREGRS